MPDRACRLLRRAEHLVDFAGWVRGIRRALGLTQRQLTRLLGSTRQSVANALKPGLWLEATPGAGNRPGPLRGQPVGRKGCMR